MESVELLIVPAISSDLLDWWIGLSEYEREWIMFHARESQVLQIMRNHHG